MKVTTKLALTAAITTFVASPAFADNNEVKTPSASVEYGDLDLNSSAGRDILDRRVDQAIRSLCKADNRGVSAQYRATECRLAARASASPQVRFAILDAKGTALALNAQAIEVSQAQGCGEMPPFRSPVSPRRHFAKGGTPFRDGVYLTLPHPCLL